MSTIPPITGSSSAAVANSPNTKSALSTLDPNAFLSILSAEMQNQDPTQPSDPTQWVTQLSQLTGVQQTVQTNTTLSQLLSLQSMGQAASAVGRSVTSADGSTAGVITSVVVNQGQLTATLSNGSTLLLGNGVTFS